MELKINSLLQDGKYRIIRVLGQGGFGITYLAENTYLDKKVAIKEFFPKDFCWRGNTSHLTLGTQNNAETVAKLKDRFLKEAKNIAKLDHPGIVKIHDIFEENNTAYYVMDYIEGENLNEIVKRNGPLTEAKAVEYIVKVGEALEYIHSRNMTHLDIKPANIVVRRSDDQPILIDFGLSKQYDIHGDATSTLMQGVSYGYSPIELYNAGAITSLSPQTDVYSLGATLFYLITGAVPPSASQVLNDDLKFPLGVTLTNQTAILRAMSIRKSDRYVSAVAFTHDLRLPKETPVQKFEPKSKCEDETELLNSTIPPIPKYGSKLYDNILSLDDVLRTKDAEVALQKEILTKKDNELKLLHISNEEKKSKISELSSQIESVKSAKNTAWTIGILGFIILGIICIGMNSSKSSKLAQRDNIIKAISNNSEVFISDIEIRNDGEKYEGKIYSRNTTFINPRFKVINLSNNSKTIGVKFYAPYGLATGDGSKNGYSYTETIPAKYGSNTSSWFEGKGWGNIEKGSWMSGKYRIEFWVDGKCAATKHFTVH